MKELFKTIIKDFHAQIPFREVRKRELQIPLRSQKIISLTGPRRCGKTFYFYSLINRLMEDVPVDRIIYINFEDERMDIHSRELHLILDAYYELYPGNYNQEIFVFFDEIQNIDGWEAFVRRLNDTFHCHIFITGSSAKMLGKEIATSLRGRSVNYQMFPLSFEEYCQFQGIDSGDVYSTPGKARLRSQFQAYLKNGGYPEVLILPEELVNKTLQSYFDVMLFRDIVERYNVSNTVVLKQFIKKLVNTISSEFSIHKFYNELKSQGISISKNTVYEYLEYATDCFLLFLLLPYDPSLVRQQTRSKKIYAVDTGLINAITYRFSQDRGKLLENAVFLELSRREMPLFYHKNQFECDFIVQQEEAIKEAYQVSLTVSQTETRQREIRALQKTMDKFNLSEGCIITLDEEEDIELNNKRIAIKPAWKWFLRT